MIKKFILVIPILLSGILFSQHKFVNPPKLSDADLMSEKSEKYPDAPAEVLYRSIHFVIDYNGYLTKNVVDRVKIYNKNNASKYLDQKITLYDNGKGLYETLSNLKANTYNFENGKKVTTKVERNEKYNSTEDKNYKVTKFAFSGVKDGSVVECSYSVYTPFMGSTPRVLIEDEIPVRYVEFVFDTPKPFGYTINYKGDISPQHRVVEEAIMYGNPYFTYRFGYDDVPAFKDEKYVQNNDNYKTGVKAEINSVMNNGVLKPLAMSWKDIRKRLYDHDDFGGQLSKNHLAKDLLPATVTDLPSNMEKAKQVLKYVQQNYTWNKEDDVVTDKGIRNLITTKVGNSAEINLLLTMLLRNVGINADPVVLSTIKRGMLLAYNPSVNQLNYVLSSFEDNGKLYLLDGTLKQSEINLISPKALNYYGIIMTKDDAKQINILYPEVSQNTYEVDAKMNPDGTFEGRFSDRDNRLFALVANERYLEDKEKFSKTYRENYKFPYSNITHQLQENGDFTTSFDFSGDTFADVIGNKIVFNPLLFLYTQNHDFNQTEPRRAPLEFYSAFDRVKKVTITLPENYVFENIPKSKKFRTEDSALQYSYVVTQEGNKLTVETTVKVDDPVFPKEYYPAFTQIFDNITKQEAQVVTAVKR